MKSNKTIEEYQRRRGYLLCWSVPGLILGLTLFFLSWPIEATLDQRPYGLAFILAVFGSIGFATWAFFIPYQSDCVNGKPTILAWLVCAICTISAIGCALVVASLLLPNSPLDLQEGFGLYFRMVQEQPDTVSLAYLDWIKNILVTGHVPPSWILSAMVFFSMMAIGIIQNPYDDRRSLHGHSRPATYQDLKRWGRWRDGWFTRKRQPLEFLDDGGIVLGKFKISMMRSTILQRNETLTGLALAAPGAGKTAGLALPTILSKGMRKWSMFIFDIKGELFDESAGWRSSLGPVLRFEPNGRSGARWNPLSPMKSLPDKGGYLRWKAELEKSLGKLFGENNAVEARITLQRVMRNSANWREDIVNEPDLMCGSNLAFTLKDKKQCLEIIKSEVIAHARQMSGDQSRREEYWRKLSFQLLPEPKGGGSGNSDHFLNRGRTAGFALMGWATNRAERLGVEPHFGLLIDYWTDALANAGGDPDGDMNQQSDALTETIQSLIEECQAYGYPEQIRQELMTLKTTGDDEKGSIFSTLDNGLNIFKLATVRDRTSTSDFSIEDLRGMKGKDGKEYPLTLYLVVTLENIKSMGPIMAMLTEATMSFLISQPAKLVKKARRVLYLLDEFAQIQKMQCILSAPAVGRGMRVASLLIAQSYGQIEDIYGQAGLKQLKDTSEWKIIHPLTDQSTAEDVSKMIGNATMEDMSESGAYGGFGGFIAAIVDGFSGKNQTSGMNRTRSLKSTPLFSASDLMSTDNGGKMQMQQQIILGYRKYNRPIVCDVPLYFKEKSLQRRSRMPAPEPAEDSPNAMGFCGKLAHLRVEETVRSSNDNAKPASKGLRSA